MFSALRDDEVLRAQMFDHRFPVRIGGQDFSPAVRLEQPKKFRILRFGNSILQAFTSGQCGQGICRRLFIDDLDGNPGDRRVCRLHGDFNGSRDFFDLLLRATDQAQNSTCNQKSYEGLVH